jgi:cytoskeletal protein RodZ
MLRKLRTFKGQSTLEYAILIVIIIGALLSIQIYIKRGIQGRLRSATDDISADQFSPGNTNYTRTTRTRSETTQAFQDGVTESRLVAPETTDIEVNQQIINTEQEYWGSAQDQQ